MKKLNKVIVNNETGMIFATTQEATKTLNVNNGSLSKCVNGKRNTAGKYNDIPMTWRTATKQEIKAFVESKYFEDGKANLKDLDVNDKRKNKRVICLDNNKVFDSIIKANKYVNGDIYYSLNHKKPYKNGMTFMYLDEYVEAISE